MTLIRPALQRYFKEHYVYFYYYLNRNFVYLGLRLDMRSTLHRSIMNFTLGNDKYEGKYF